MLDVEHTESAYVAASMGMSEVVLTHQGRICSSISCSFPTISMCCLTEENSASDVLLAATEKGFVSAVLYVLLFVHWVYCKTHSPARVENCGERLGSKRLSASSDSFHRGLKAYVINEIVDH